MQITLNQDEIETAIKDYVSNQIVIAEDMEIAVDMKAGRGDNGYTATLDIRPAKTVKKKTAYRSELPAAEIVKNVPKVTGGIIDKVTETVEKVKDSAPEPMTDEELTTAMGGTTEVPMDDNEKAEAPTEDQTVAGPQTIEVKKAGSIFNFAKTGTE